MHAAHMLAHCVPRQHRRTLSGMRLMILASDGIAARSEGRRRRGELDSPRKGYQRSIPDAVLRHIGVVSTSPADWTAPPFGGQ